ncbi:MAG: hypothetical protein QXO84_03680 [Candidatus Aenigmatarchaeota archaeon]
MVAYEEFQKKYELPSIVDLENEFGIELKKKSVNEVIESIIDVFSENAKLLESLLFIDSGSSPSKLYEASMLRENEIDVFYIYKQLMAMFWQGKKSLFSVENKQKAEFIKNSYKNWKELKNELIKVFDLFEKEWPSVVFRQSDQTIYHG